MTKRTAAQLLLAVLLGAPAFSQTVVQPVPAGLVQAPVILQTNILQSANLSGTSHISPLSAAFLAVPKAVDMRLPTALPAAPRMAPSSQVEAVLLSPERAAAQAARHVQAVSGKLLVPDVSKHLPQAIREYSKPEHGQAGAVDAKNAALFDGSRIRAESQDEAAVQAFQSPAAPQAKAGYLQETEGQTGRDLLSSLHRLVSKSHQERGYNEARHYMYSVADNQVSHGVRGIMDAYSGIFLPGQSGDGAAYKERGDENGDGFVDHDGVNAEHVWPQSFFNKQSPMRSDLHHLMATLMHPNSVRGHLPFGEVSAGHPDYDNNGGAKMGEGVFEPPDITKGRVARAVLYFYTRYFDRDIFSGDSRGFFKERIELFLRWNREHPPTEFERRRNDLVEQWQGNRNPFTDAPELADRIGVEGFRGLASNPIRPDMREEDLKRDYVKDEPNRTDDVGRQPGRRHPHHHRRHR